MFMLFALGDLTLGNGLRLEGRLLHPLLRAHSLATQLRHSPDGVVLLQVLNASGHPCEKPPQTKLLRSAEETYFVRRRKYFSLRRFRTLLRSVFYAGANPVIPNGLHRMLPRPYGPDDPAPSARTHIIIKEAAALFAAFRNI